MDTTQAELERKLDQLKNQLAQHQENLTTVVTLLDKADRRRLEEPADSNRWNRVLENLESCLDEAKARVGACQAAIEQAQRQLGEFRPGEFPAPSLPPEMETLDFPPLPPASLEAARRILSMPLEEVSKLTLEEVALLHSQIASERTETLAANTERILGRLELAIQTQKEPVESSTGDASSEKRHQLLLRHAIDKVNSGHLTELTEQETKLLLSSYELVHNRLTPRAKDERLRRILGAAVNVVLHRKQAEVRRAQEQG